MGASELALIVGGGDVVPTALLVSAIEQSALAGDAARDNEFYLSVLHDDGELWQLHRILTGGPFAWDDDA